MAIVKMKHLQLIAMGSDREALLRLFQRMGCVEIDQICVESPGDTQGGTEIPEDRQALLRRMEEDRLLFRPDAQALSEARDRLNGVERALEALKKYAPDKVSFLAPKPGLTEGELFDEAAGREALAAAERINEMERRIAAIESEFVKTEGQLAQLAPWQGLDVPLDTQSTQLLTLQLGTLPAIQPFDGAEAALGPLSQLTLVSADRELQYCLLMCHASEGEAALEALKELGWSRANLREWTGTAAENMAALEARLEELNREKGGLLEEMSAMGTAWPGLKRLADRAAADVSREESRGRTLDTSQTFYLEGWVPEARWPEVEQALAPYPHACTLTDPAPEDYPKVPVQLKNNWFTKPLNMVTEMYSLPAYGSVDPNPLMAPFFILFYGMMMADMGYGLVMLLLGLLLVKKKKATGTMGHMGGLLLLCGVSTFAFGVITGGFFGDFLTQLFNLIEPGSNFALPALFTPLEDTMMILIGSMCLGAVHIITGMAVSFVRKLRAGQFMDALWEEITWWVVFAGGALAVLGVTNLVLILGGIMVLAGPLITGTGMGRITGIFGSLYNHITGYFGDILSYSRLMALMLAGSVIAQVFNTLGAIPGNIILFLVISFLGNALNFALNLLGCYVHDLRLQCLEYFGKFYEDGGKPFRPLDMNTKYHNLVK